MKITDLKANQVVHCKTHEDAVRVLKLAHEAGLKWCSDKSYIETDMWNTYKDKTCYELISGHFADMPYYQGEDFEIISSEKIIDMENKTEFFEERVMEVSGDGTTWYTRVVFGKKNGKYIAWINATTVEEAKKVTGITTWKLAREIKPKPKYVPFTFEDDELSNSDAYEKCKLVAREDRVYTADGKYMFSVSMTDRAKALLDNDGWEKGKESWLDYRKRTEAERKIEKKKQYKLATDLAEAFNRMQGN